MLRVSHDYDADEKAAREARPDVAGRVHRAVGWRIRNKKTTILGAAKAPDNANAILLASASGSVAPSPDCTIKGNVNGAGECIYHTPASRWYAQIKMHISKGTRWFLLGGRRRSRRLPRDQAIAAGGLMVRDARRRAPHHEGWKIAMRSDSS